MRKRAQCHDLAAPHFRVVPACLKPTYSANRVCAAFANRQRLNLHRTQTRQEKRGRKLLPIDFPVDLFGRFINADGFQASRQLFVADFFPPHLHSQYFPSMSLPFIPYVGWSFRRVQRHIWLQLIGLLALVSKKSVLYDRKPIITTSVFLHECTGHFFGNTEC